MWRDFAIDPSEPRREDMVTVMHPEGPSREPPHAEKSRDPDRSPSNSGVSTPAPEAAAPSSAYGVLVFGAGIFLSAFLLFQVQPVIARYILPWYGGSPAVWTTCLLFFQLGLLGGYAYAHALVSILRERTKAQVIIHGSLVIGALLLLPITPSPEMKPVASTADPAWGILGLLLRTVAAPYLLLSATGPLFQHWFSRSYPGRSPFRLYAVSNLGSMLGLLTYPFLIERLLNVSQQTLLWSGAFVGYAVLALVAGWVFLKFTGHLAASAPEDASSPERIERPRPGRILLWILFSTCGSVLLLSLTSQMTQDIAVVPFLWVVPLSLYLLTFVIAFDHPRWYRRRLVLPMVVVSVASTLFLMNWEHLSDGWPLVTQVDEWPLALQVVVYCSTIFFTCLLCHGEIVRRKPHPRHLTGFYLAISFGGAMGGILVSLVAPRLFDGYWELHLTLIVLALLASGSLVQPVRNWCKAHSGQDRPVRLAMASGFLLAWVICLVAMVMALAFHKNENRAGVVAASRGFYGVLQVTSGEEGTERHVRSLYHGRINHGCQYLAPQYRRGVTTYFGVKSGVGTAFRCLPERATKPASPIKVGIIGLGVGTIAAYAKPGDQFRFYEINPQVEAFARSHFTYLDDCKGDVSVVLGDARITLEAELESGTQVERDLLIIDAFSGDAIPIHLLTREAFELYTRHIKPDGVLAFHITNRHVDLSDPLRNIAGAAGYEAFLISNDPDSTFGSDWVLVTRDPAFVTTLKETGRVSPWVRLTPKATLWSDDYSNLFDVLD